MSESRDNHHPRSEQAERLPADVARLGAMLDARGRTQRDALSAEALERITAMSDLQLPIAGSDAPVVLARIEPSGSSSWRSPRVWRIAAAVALIAGLGAAAVFVVRGLGGDAAVPEGTLVDGSQRNASEPTTAPVRVPTVAPNLAPEHLEHALARGAHSASTVLSRCRAL